MVNDSFWHAFDEGHLKREEILQLYKEINENALVNLPEDLRITTHICRGNYDSTWASEGGYGPAAPYVFKEKGVEAFYLEFDDDRSGDFAPLAEVPADKVVVLGLVTSKKPELEDPEALKARIKEAGQYHPLATTALSTQCGFASTEEGNHLTDEEQWAKIKLVIDTAKEVWPDAE